MTRLLAAFYFRQHGSRRDGERTFEFTHKSFGEYLTARRIVRAIKRMHDERQRQRDAVDDGWSERDALKHWAEICGPSTMDAYLHRLVQNELRLQPVEQVAAWHDTICELIGYLLAQGMPMQMLHLNSYREEKRQARNAEEALMAARSGCASVVGCLSKIEWPGSTSLGERRAAGRQVFLVGEHPR